MKYLLKIVIFSLLMFFLYVWEVLVWFWTFNSVRLKQLNREYNQVVDSNLRKIKPTGKPTRF